MADALAAPDVLTPAVREHYPSLMARAARDALALADAWLEKSDDAEPELCTLNEAFETTIQRNSGTAELAGAQLYLRCPPEPGRQLVDRRQTLQILSNLVGNALKHGGGGLSIELSATMQRGRLELQVKDNGCGMSDLAATRAGRHMPTPTGGHGLGLAIVERMVTPFGGRLTLESSLGKGVCVRVLLPHAKRRVDDLAALAAVTTRTGAAEDCAEVFSDRNGGPNGPLKRTA
jgi:signal transduction histidine kinase